MSYGAEQQHPHALGHAHRVVLRLERRAEQDELVSAVAGDDVAVAHRGAQACGDLDEQPVAGRVAEGVVDLLEAVEVAEHHGEVAPVRGGGAQVLVELGDERVPVDQAGQSVVRRLELQALRRAVALDGEPGQVAAAERRDAAVRVDAVRLSGRGSRAGRRWRR